MKTASIVLGIALGLAGICATGGEISLPTKPCQGCEGRGQNPVDCPECAQRWNDAKVAAVKQARADLKAGKITREQFLAASSATKPDATGCPACKGAGQSQEICHLCRGRGYMVLDAKGNPSEELTRLSPETPQSARLEAERQVRELDKRIATLEAELAAAKAKAAALRATMGQATDPGAGAKGPGSSGLPLVTPKDKPKIMIEDGKGNRWELAPKEDPPKEAEPKP